MVHSHTCEDCGVVLEMGAFDCDATGDHPQGRCDRCAAGDHEGDEAIEIGGEG